MILNPNYTFIVNMTLNPDYTFIGTDEDLEISLFEYQLICSVKEHEDGSGTHFCVYASYDGFDTGHISEEQVNGYVLGKEFPNAVDIKGFLNFEGQTESEWLARPFVTKLNDLISYWGCENIMGSSYSIISEKEMRKSLNAYLKQKLK